MQPATRCRVCSGVKAGEYGVMAVAKGQGRGKARAHVVAGQTANLEINLVAQTAPAGEKPAKQNKPAKPAKGPKPAKVQ